MKIEKFINVDGDYEVQIAERNLVLRLTPMRYKIITKSIKKWNYQNQFPYGISPNGYAYRCGCEHDCCGCLVGQNMSFHFNKIENDLYSIIIRYSVNYNY